jgi:hypothetical protein
VYQKPEAPYTFRIQKNDKNIIEPFPGAVGNLQSVVSLIATYQALNIWESDLARKSGKAILSCCV